MITSGWGAWALSPCGLVLVFCSSVCLSQQPHVKPADCSRKEHPVVSYQGECITTSLLFLHLHRDFFYHPSLQPYKSKVSVGDWFTQSTVDVLKMATAVHIYKEVMWNTLTNALICFLVETQKRSSIPLSCLCAKYEAISSSQLAQFMLRNRPVKSEFYVFRLFIITNLVSFRDAGRQILLPV